MGYLPLKHVGNGCLTSVRVVGEPSTLSDAEVVKHEERGEVAEGGSANGSADDSTNALLSFDGEDAFYDGSCDTGHVSLL